MTIFDEKRAELEKFEFMMGTERGRLAVALDLLTDSLILTGQHGVYCVSNRNPSQPRLDLQAVLAGIDGAKELIQSVMAELQDKGTSTPAANDQPPGTPAGIREQGSTR